MTTTAERGWFRNEYVHCDTHWHVTERLMDVANCPLCDAVVAPAISIPLAPNAETVTGAPIKHPSLPSVRHWGLG